MSSLHLAGRQKAKAMEKNNQLKVAEGECLYQGPRFMMEKDPEQHVKLGWLIEMQQ